MTSRTDFFVHESSYVDDNVAIGDKTKIWHFSHVLADTTIGSNCSFGQNCVVGPKVSIGNGVKVQNNVSIYTGVICEDDVFLGPSMVFTNVVNPRSAVIRRGEYTRTLVKNAAEKVKQIATIANYLEVKAPNDGIIVQKGIRVGDLIVPGMLAMVLVDLDHLEIEGQVSETDLLKITKGDFIDVAIPSLKFKTRGRVKSIVPSANPMTHTFTIRVSFHKGHEKIFPGMYAKLKIEYNEEKN